MQGMRLGEGKAEGKGGSRGKRLGTYISPDDGEVVLMVTSNQSSSATAKC